jgi:hypothetical protein
MKTTNGEESPTELNSGVQCPGNKSLEPYIGTVMTLEDATFTDEAILVEIAQDGLFAFQYTKEERAMFGSCEWCNQNKLL